MKRFFPAFLAALLLPGCASGEPEIRPWQEDILVADRGPVPLGECETAAAGFFSGGLAVMKMQAAYHPRTDAVTLEFRAGQLYRQFWNRRMRTAFLEALAAYEADYAARNLPKSSVNRTGRQYGILRGKLEWRLSGITREYQGFPAVELGYRFDRGNPYFTVTWRIVKDERDPDPSKQVTSGRVVLYFTRAMARELAAFFDEELLDGIVPDGDVAGNGPPAAPSPGVSRIPVDTPPAP